MYLQGETGPLDSLDQEPSDEVSFLSKSRRNSKHDDTLAEPPRRRAPPERGRDAKEETYQFKMIYIVALMYLVTLIC